MRLTFTCSSCKTQNYLKESAATRPDLQLSLKSDEVRVNCQFCAKMDKKHINRITAVADNRVLILGSVLGLIISLILIYYLGFIAALAFSSPIFVWRYESENAHKFNSYAIRRK
jgi:hypothetical protein